MRLLSDTCTKNLKEITRNLLVELDAWKEETAVTKESSYQSMAHLHHRTECNGNCLCIHLILFFLESEIYHELYVCYDLFLNAFK